MTTKGKIIFVTTELFPFTGGGIGRFTFNVLKNISDEERRRVIVLLTHGKISNSAFQVTFPGARLVQVSESSIDSGAQGLATSPADEWFSLSVRLLAILQDLASKERIDYLEFPDWSGLAFATLQEKRFRGFLWDTTIAVRLHSTEAVLVLAEGRRLNAGDLRRYDLERKSLRDCDVIAAHLEPVAEATRRAFGFDVAEWQPRLYVAAPPMFHLESPRKQQGLGSGGAVNIAFTSKFQEFKKPEIFVQGATLFLSENPDFSGDILLLCWGLKSDYARKILEMIPAEHRGRFRMLEGLTHAERDEFIASSVVVFPSVFESYCLAAFEAAKLGAVIVVNERNPAFGENTPWIDGENCLKFDGSAIGISKALSGYFRSKRRLNSVTPIPQVQVWERHVETKKLPWRKPATEPLVTVVIINQNQGNVLGATLQSFAGVRYANLELVVIDDGSTDPVSPLVMQSLAASVDSPIAVKRFPSSIGFAAAKNAAVEAASGKYVLIVASGDLVHGDFVADAVSSLENNDDFDIVVSQAGYYSDADRVVPQRVETCVGEAQVTGTAINYYSNGGWLCRTSLARTVCYRHEVGCLDNWAWMMEAVAAGSRVIAAPRIGVSFREMERSDSAVATEDSARLYHLMVAGGPNSPLRFPVAMLSHVAKPHPTRAKQADWYRHMIENSYEPEVEFLAKVVGHTWLGKLARRNRGVSDVIERAIRVISGMK